MQVGIKGLSYALQSPSREMLYIVTTDAIKFKAKSWIDIFGQRGSKALGSVVTNAFSDSAPDLLNYGSGVAIALTVWLLYISNYMGKTFDEYIGSGYIVGGDAEKEVETSDDTSCAIDDDSKSKDKDETAV